MMKISAPLDGFAFKEVYQMQKKIVLIKVDQTYDAKLLSYNLYQTATFITSL